MSQWSFFNTDFVKEEKAQLSFRDLSVQRGYGVFDFFKIVNSTPVYLEEHLQRFFSSAKEMRLPVKYSPQQLNEIILQLIKKNEAANTGVKIILTGGSSKDGYQIENPNLVILLQSFLAPSKEQFEKGVRLISYPHQRQLPHIKTIDYIMPIYLQPWIQQKNADDVLFYQNGMMSECPRSNIFIVTEKGTLITPSKNILKGIVRNQLVEAAKKEMAVEERDIALEEAFEAKEIFITSTTKTILPVSQLNRHILPSSKPIAAHLYKVLNNLF